jgi:hypothetical protein
MEASKVIARSTVQLIPKEHRNTDEGLNRYASLMLKYWRNLGTSPRIITIISMMMLTSQIMSPQNTPQLNPKV